MAGQSDLTIRGVALEAGERVLRKAHAALDISETGDLYLTSRRLVWVSHRIRIPGVKDRQIVVPLADIQACHVVHILWVMYAIEIETQSQTQFMLYRWIGPLLGWRGLMNQWARAINETRRETAAPGGTPQPFVESEGDQATSARNGAAFRSLLPGMAIILTWMFFTPIWIGAFLLIGFSSTAFLITGIVEAICLLVGALLVVAPTTFWRLATFRERQPEDS